MKLILLPILAVLFLTVAAAAQNSEQFFDSGGVKIHYSVAGFGEPVVLIHGWASNGAQNWAAVIKDLSADHLVIAMDCRGHGQSDKPHEPSAYGTEMVEDVVRLMDHLQIKRAHIAGYSMGAEILLKLLAAHPERVLSAVLAGQGGVREDTLEKTEDPVLKYLDEGLPIADALIAAVPQGATPPSKTEQMLMKIAFAGNDSKALAAAKRSFSQLLVTNAELRRMQTPVLAIYSIEGATVKPLKDLLPNAELIEITGANHTTAPFKPLFVSSIREFLTRHQTSRARNLSS